jgi:hypothetical protein
MNRNETKAWINYHLSIFPDFRTWWQGQSKESRALMFEGYSKALKQFELTEAQQASDAILAGDAKKPWDHQDTLSALVAAARGIRRDKLPQRIEGKETFGCGSCLDTGWLEHAYTEANVKAIFGDAYGRFAVYADGFHFYATICPCGHGDKHRGLPWGSAQAVQQR